MVAEYKADGLLLAPSRSCETDFRNGYIGMQRIFKDEIPTVEYDTDQVDVRKMDLPGSQRKTELFVHLMEARRKGVQIMEKASDIIERFRQISEGPHAYAKSLRPAPGRVHVHPCPGGDSLRSRHCTGEDPYRPRLTGDDEELHA